MSASQIASLLFILLALGYGYFAAGLPTETISGEPSAALFPLILTFLLLGLSLALLLQEVRNKAAVKIIFRITPQMMKTAAGLLVVITYLKAIPYLGFIIPSMIFFALLMGMGGERRLTRIILFSLLLPLVLFYLFREVFQIPIPQWGIFQGVF
jgi:hypothetical protein